MIQQNFETLCNTHSDINEHLPILKEYAEKCEHITEMGVRWITSTFAFLMANPKTLISIDKKHPTEFELGKERWETLNKCLEQTTTNFTFIKGDTNNMEIEETDFLFIDTWHVYDCLKKELELHGNKSKKYLGFHDTTSYGNIGETEGYEGIWRAIEEFLNDNPHWVIKEKRTNNNGLIILERI